MSHWYTQDRLASEHRADLDREADRRYVGRLVEGRHGDGPFAMIVERIKTIQRRRLEAELRTARRQVEALERQLGYVRAE